MIHRRCAAALRIVVAAASFAAGRAAAQPTPPVAAAPSDESSAHTADHWITRIADALRVRDTMSAHAHVEVDHPGREEDFSFDMQILRDAEGGATRTLFKLRETGDTRSVVNELVDKPGEPLTNWYWDLQKRRWISIRGLQATDPFADTAFRYEDLWFVEPTLRRNGSAKWVEDGGRRWIEIASAPYHYYQSVVTRVDPETGLPQRVRFIDNTGTPIREQHYEKVTLVDGRPFPTVVRLRDLAQGGETTITFGDVRFGGRIPPSYFDLSVMDDRLRRGADPVPEPPPPRKETPPSP